MLKIDDDAVMVHPYFTLMIKAALAVLLTAAIARSAPTRDEVWFRGDFETGGLRGWSGDLARRDSAVVVTAPVRKGRYAVRITLAPGDVAASKERAELKLGDKEIERRRGSEGGEVWYGWSLLIPADYADPPGDQFQILAQWHHRPTLPAGPGRRRHLLKGPPPLMLHLVGHAGRHVLMLIGQTSPTAPPRRLGAQAVSTQAWIDLVFHIRWSTGRDGFVEAWLNGRPFTNGRVFGPTLYTPKSNYLRLGLYRGKGVRSTNHIYLDEVRLGSSRQAVSSRPAL